MDKGIAVPLRVTTRGGLATCTGAEENGKVILLAMLDGDNTNPWNRDVGLDPALFGLDTPGQRALLKRGIEKHFKRLQAANRVQLVGLDYLPGEQPQEVQVRASYVDLDTDQVHEATKTYTRG